MTAFPTWMYRDPAETVERIEGMELRAEARARIREITTQQELEQATRSMLERAAYAVRRAIFPPPEIRMKRARIQALARKAMKERA